MKTKTWITLALLLVCSWAFSQGFYQKRRYVDFGLGPSSYFGDLSASTPFAAQPLSLSGSLGFNIELNPFIWLRNSVGIYPIKAQDIDSKDPFKNTRNLHFKNNLLEFSSVANLDLLGEKHYFKPGKYKPYISLGLALFYSEPKARTPASFGGDWVSLKPLRTEGKSYSNWNLAIPFGFGCDVQLVKNLDLSAEFLWRITSSDFLDDVSGKYLDLNTFPEGSLASALSDRSTETLGGYKQVPRNPKFELHRYDSFETYSGFSHPRNPDNRRGDKIPFDSYFSFQIRLKYLLPLSKRQITPKHDYPYAKEIQAPDWVYQIKVYDRFEVELLKINTVYSEIASCFVGNQLVFISDVPTTRFFKPKPFHKFFYRYYITPIADLSRNELTRALLFADKNDSKKDYFTASYREEENLIYFSALENFSKKAKEAVYTSFFRDKALDKSNALNIPDFGLEPSEPFITQDGSTIFFVAYTPRYKSDIYVSFRDSLNWTTPLRLPYPINTEDNEFHPTFHVDGTLYFSSDRPEGHGGSDIYEVINQDIISPEIALLPPPINSSGDDFGLLLDYYKRFGIFTSTRSGGIGEEDIYSIKVNELSKTSRLLSDTNNLQKSQQLILLGQVLASDGAAIKGAVVKKLDMLTDGVEITFTDSYGLFSFLLTNDSDYKIAASAQGFEPSKDTLLATVSMDLKIPEIELNFVLSERVIWSKLLGNVISRGEPVPNVKVFLKDLKTEAVQEATTTLNGYYEFTINSKHPYLVLYQAQGFKPTSLKINSHNSEFSENLRYNITLERLPD
jgi:hypothetical protein